MTFDVRNYGAVAQAGVMNTAAIQSAIDACHSSGGGKVVISGGTYMTGTLVMKSNVNLSIEASGVLLASPNCGKYNADSQFDLRPYPYNVIYTGEIDDYGDYPDIEKEHVDTAALPRNRGCCLIYAENAENISITGMGKIDANGTAFTELAPKEANHYTQYRRIHAPTPPRVVFFTGCQNVCVENISLVNSPAGWSYWIHDCDYVTFDKVKIISDLKYPNNDGIHINCSRNVTVSNACIICSDDCIVIRANSRSLKENKICEKVTVTNCNLTTSAAGVRVGFVNDGVIRNCAVSNMVITNSGVGILLDFPAQELIQSDFGREATEVENPTINTNNDTTIGIANGKILSFFTYFHTKPNKHPTRPVNNKNIPILSKVKNNPQIVIIFVSPPPKTSLLSLIFSTKIRHNSITTK